MSKIYIEVPKTTNMTTVSVPCGKEGDYADGVDDAMDEYGEDW